MTNSAYAFYEKKKKHVIKQFF